MGKVPLEKQESLPQNVLSASCSLSFNPEKKGPHGLSPVLPIFLSERIRIAPIETPPALRSQRQPNQRAHVAGVEEGHVEDQRATPQQRGGLGKLGGLDEGG